MANYYLFELASPQPLRYSSAKRKELKAYLNQIWRFQPYKDFFDTAPSENQPFIRFQEKTIRNIHFTGILSFQGDVFYLLPKLFTLIQPVDISLIFNHLTYYLSYTSRTNFAWQMAQWDTIEAHVEGIDIWLFWWVSMVERVLEGKSMKKFEQAIQPSQQYKGRISWSPYTQKSLPKADWHILFNDYQHFTENNTLSQLLKYVARQIQSLTQNSIVLDKITQILYHLSGVTYHIFSYQDACNISINRLQIQEVWILDVCKMLLLNDFINEQLGSTHNFSFFFPMDRLYEGFIAGFIRFHFPEISVQSQSVDYLAKTKIGEKPVFQIKNDLYVPEKNLIIDTKYKIRKNTKNKSAGIDEKDLYQVLSYGIAKDCQNLCLLYPTQLGAETNNLPNEWVISGELLNSQKIQVSAFDLDICTNSVDNLPEKLDTKIKLQLQKILEK